VPQLAHFLFVAYREMKRLELVIEEKPLPLDNLDQNILCADALFTAWPKADAIIGNPPYLGSCYLAKEHGYDYANKIYARFPGIPKMADFCTHWFRLAHDALAPGGRAGLVGTNTIRQNESREASLDYLVANGGVITDAVGTQVWSGDAAVHVSIVNWGRVGVPPAGPGVSPGPSESFDASLASRGSGASDDSRETRESAGGTPTLPGNYRLAIQRGDHVDSPWETFALPQINSALSVATDVTGAQVLAANAKADKCYQGQNPVNAGFFLTPDEAADMIKADPRNREVLFPYMIGRDLLEHYGPSRWIIDFAKRDTFAARAYPIPFEHVKERVMPVVIAKAETEKASTGKENTRWTRMAERWWQFRDWMPGTMAAIGSVPRYIAISRVTKRPIFEFISKEIHPDGSLVIFGLADDYSFGILQSGIHYGWFKALCSSLKGDFRYTSDTVFDTFPWPQTPTREQVAAVAAAAVTLRALRREIMGKLQYSLRDLYRTLEEPGANPLRAAHAKLDTAVRAAYAMPTAADPLAFLLALNLELAAKEKAREKITPPGLPLPGSEHAIFVSDDCVRVNAP
jgi:hypothetical protein